MRGLISPIATFLLSASSAAEERQHSQLMDQIEKQMRMPAGSRPLAEYARYYAFEKKERVIGIYTTWIEPDYASLNLPAGQRRWVSDEATCLASPREAAEWWKCCSTRPQTMLTGRMQRASLMSASHPSGHSRGAPTIADFRDYDRRRVRLVASDGERQDPNASRPVLRCITPELGCPANPAQNRSLFRHSRVQTE
jgi:hypothetical protein